MSQLLRGKVSFSVRGSTESSLHLDIWTYSIHLEISEIRLLQLSVKRSLCVCLWESMCLFLFFCFTGFVRLKLYMDVYCNWFCLLNSFGIAWSFPAFLYLNLRSRLGLKFNPFPCLLFLCSKLSLDALWYARKTLKDPKRYNTKNRSQQAIWCGPKSDTKKSFSDSNPHVLLTALARVFAAP